MVQYNYQLEYFVTSMLQTKFGRPLQEMSSGQLIEYAKAIMVQYNYQLGYPSHVVNAL